MRDFLVSAAWGVAVAAGVALVILAVLRVLGVRPDAGWSTVVVGGSVAVASLVVAIGEDVRDALRRRRDE